VPATSRSRADYTAAAVASFAYELGVLKVLPMPAHLAFDAAKGVFMASSPWLFGFAKNGGRYWMPHVLMGTADVLAAITSKTD
jgi:hypothetical protein